MMSAKPIPINEVETILLVENDVLERTALAEYMRHCGYRVIEVATEEDAKIVISDSSIKIDILVNAIPSFSLMKWAMKKRPEIRVISAGSLETAARVAGELCEDGPHLKKPYEPQQVIDWIRRMQASKHKTK